MKAFLKWIIKLFCISKKSKPVVFPSPPTDYPVFKTTWDDVRKELTALGLKAMEAVADKPDIAFYYTTEEHWAEIIISEAQQSLISSLNRPKHFSKAQEGGRIIQWQH